MRTFVTAIWNTSAIMTLPILLLMVVSPLLSRRYRARSVYAAWLILTLGLLYPLMPRIQLPVMQTTQSRVSVAAIRNTLAEVLPVVERTGTDAAQAEGLTQQSLDEVPPAQSMSGSYGRVLRDGMVIMIWLAGFLFFLGFHAVRHIRFMRAVRRWREPVTDGSVLSVWEGAKAALGVGRQVELYTCPCVPGPVLVGLFRPTVLLPSVNWKPEELRLVLTHELVHLRRADLWYKLVLLGAMALHWFNPAVYLMAREVDRQCELSCDEQVIRCENEEARRLYGTVILCAAYRRTQMVSALSSHFYGGKQNMKHRISSIVNLKSRKTGAAVICAALLVTGAGGMGYAALATDVSAPPAVTSMAGQAHASVTIQDHENVWGEYGDSVQNVDARPGLEFYIEGDDIARIDITSENEYLDIINWTAEKDGLSGVAEVNQPLTGEKAVYAGGLLGKTQTVTFPEGFTDYDEIWYRWQAVGLYEWACENNYSRFLGVGMKADSNMTEAQKMHLAAGGDVNGQTGIGHIQLDGYSEELLSDRITISITDRAGRQTTKVINVRIENDAQRQTVVSAHVEEPAAG